MTRWKVLGAPLVTPLQVWSCLEIAGLFPDALQANALVGLFSGFLLLDNVLIAVYRSRAAPASVAATSHARPAEP